MPLGFEAWNEQQTLQVRSMCNLYSITMNHAAIRNLFGCTIPLARQQFGALKLDEFGRAKGGSREEARQGHV
jgi:hypothetical protein